MDIRIGITNSPREINFETLQSASEVEAVVANALDSAAKFFKLSDSRGNVYIVPVDSFGYLEIGTEESRRVGFVS
ncbi:DUF3107 domain-containing protein [Glaciihabitans sp. UYNi722]|uniref:DUF3107 domain-containing protein n=1 Tax=Glaciihabitans sp. UYNi722 TaxID=3156344 RepID=UPI00339976BE